MCGRYSLVRGDKIVEVVPNITMPANLRLVARYNIAPQQSAPVIANDRREVQMFRWGLVPSWARDETTGYKMINARAESLEQRPAFRKALATRRCLVPADGFYEWRRHAGGAKTAMHFHMPGGGIFAFAGLWDTWRNPAGQELKTFTIITTQANELIRPIHDRMPVILTREACAEWLERGGVHCLQPFSAAEMRAAAVGPLVNNPRNEGPELLEPAADAGNDPEQPRLF